MPVTTSAGQLAPWMISSPAAAYSGTGTIFANGFEEQGPGGDDAPVNPGNLKLIPKDYVEQMGGEATIKSIKRDVLGDSSNPNLLWDPITGDIYTPNGQRTGYNVWDYIDGE